jgi:hypothetical protein
MHVPLHYSSVCHAQPLLSTTAQLNLNLMLCFVLTVVAHRVNRQHLTSDHSSTLVPLRHRLATLRLITVHSVGLAGRSRLILHVRTAYADSCSSSTGISRLLY